MGQTWTLALRPESHEGLAVQSGQFAWLTIWSSPFAIREHPFSFSSSAMQTGRFELAVKELGDFASNMKNIVPSTRAYIDRPYGVFSID